MSIQYIPIEIIVNGRPFANFMLDEKDSHRFMRLIEDFPDEELPRES